jgi:hypothetical protein
MSRRPARIALRTPAGIFIEIGSKKQLCHLHVYGLPTAARQEIGLGPAQPSNGLGCSHRDRSGWVDPPSTGWHAEWVREALPLTSPSRFDCGPDLAREGLSTSKIGMLDEQQGPRPTILRRSVEYPL